MIVTERFVFIHLHKTGGHAAGTAGGDRISGLEASPYSRPRGPLSDLGIRIGRVGWFSRVRAVGRGGRWPGNLAAVAGILEKRAIQLFGGKYSILNDNLDSLWTFRGAGDRACPAL